MVVEEEVYATTATITVLLTATPDVTVTGRLELDDVLPALPMPTGVPIGLFTVSCSALLPL